MEKDVVIHFRNKETARQFMVWMCDAGGDQDFDTFLEMGDDRPNCNDFDFDFKEGTITERG